MGVSLTNKLNKVGERMAPWGTPEEIGRKKDEEELTCTEKVLSVAKDWMILTRYSGISRDCSL